MIRLILLTILFPINSFADYMCDIDCHKVRINYEGDINYKYFVVNIGESRAASYRVNKEAIDSYKNRNSSAKEKQDFTTYIDKQNDDMKQFCKQKIETIINIMENKGMIDANTFFLNDDNGIIVVKSTDHPKKECLLSNGVKVNNVFTAQRHLGGKNLGFFCNTDKVMLAPADGLMRTSSKYYRFSGETSLAESCIEDAIAGRPVATESFYTKEDTN